MCLFHTIKSFYLEAEECVKIEGGVVQSKIKDITTFLVLFQAYRGSAEIKIKYIRSIIRQMLKITREVTEINV